MPSKSLMLAGAVLTASGVLVAAAAPSFAGHSTNHVIKAQNIMFSPSRLVIHRGDRVTWKFLDAPLLSAHTVTSQGSRRFRDSPHARMSGSFTAGFAAAGTYRYECTVHPASMHGVVVVR